MKRVSVLVAVSLFLTMTSTLTPQESLLKALLLNQLQINRLLNQLLQSDASTFFSLKFLDMPFKELGSVVNNTGILISNEHQKETISNKLNKTLPGVADSPLGLTSTEEPNRKMHESRILTNLFNPGDMNLYEIRDKNLSQLTSASGTFTPYSKQHSILQNSVMEQSYGASNILHPSEIANKTLLKVQNAVQLLPKLSGVLSVTNEMLNSNWYDPHLENTFQNFIDDRMHKTSGFQSNTTATNRDLFQHPKPLGIQKNVGNNKQMEFPNSSSPPVHFFEPPFPRKSSIYQNYLKEPKTKDASTTVLQGRVISVSIPLTDIHLFTNLQENGNSGRVLNSKLIRPTENILHQRVSSPAKITWSIGELFASTKYPQWSTGMKQNNSQDNQKPPNSQNNEPTETVNNDPIVTVLASNNSSDPKDNNSRTTGTIAGSGPQYADRSNRNSLPVNQMRQNNNHLTTTVQTKENEISLQYPMEKQGTNKKTKSTVTKMPPAEAEVEEPEVESV